MFPVDGERFLRAIRLAQEIHKSQYRKGSVVPYISHLLVVAGKVLKEGGDEDQCIAGLLHDAVEDQGGLEILGVIENEFGERVAKIVSDCSDSFSFPKKPWRERKEYFIEKCRNLTPDSKLVVACDKWDNLYSLVVEYSRVGEDIWNRFNGGKEGTVWYYRAVIEALNHKWDSSIIEELWYLFNRLWTKLEVDL